MTLLNFKKLKIPIFIFLSFIVFLQGIFLIPPLDRDESRFAAASKNMIENNEFIDIELEGVKRYKKPVGIYWAQVISNKAFGEPPYDNISIYRLPSLIGVILSIVLVYYVTEKKFNKKTANYASLFLITSFLLISEIHQAKSDGVLFLCICICNLILLHSLQTNNNKNRINLKSKYAKIFWVFLGIGTLIKGPIILVFVGVPIISFSLISQSKFLIKSLHNFSGYIFFLIITIPWFLLITIKSNGIFWYEAVGHDLLKKVTSGQESHGFYPGYYTLLLFILFWPACFFIFGWLKNFYRTRHERIDQVTLFLLCWFLPCFVIYELIPTKLPHYVMPVYPALSILLSDFICNKKKSEDYLMKKRFIPFILIFPIIIICLFPIAVYKYSILDFEIFFLIVPLILILVFLIKNILSRNLGKFLILCVFFQLTVYSGIVYYLVPKLDNFWISSKINNIIENRTFSEKSIFHSGFNEPSLVFLLNHKANRISPEEMAKKFNNEEDCLFVMTKKVHENFYSLIDKNKQINLISEFNGFNYSQGRYINFKILSN